MTMRKRQGTRFRQIFLMHLRQVKGRLFLAADSALPVLDIGATTEQLETLVRDLHAALAARETAR